MADSAVRERLLIICADDFGMSVGVNEAVRRACLDGVLTATSLMVSSAAAAQAVDIARTLPQLRVGLHVVLTDGYAVLPHEQIPALVDQTGRFRKSMVADSFRLAALPSVRRQLAAEIRAQFSAFARTGLALDHVNAHKHFHMHPGVLDLILDVGREWGPFAVRLPREPLWFARQVAGLPGMAAALALSPWIGRMRRRLRSQGVSCNDQIFGIACTGQLTEQILLNVIERLPSGASEVYLHPAAPVEPGMATAAANGNHAQELQALLSPRVAAAIARSRATVGGYADLLRTRRPISARI